MIETNGQKTAVALGTFDGLHRGHLSVIDKAAAQKAAGLFPVLLLFSEHPLRYLTGNAPKELLAGGVREREIAKTGCTPYIVSFERIHAMTPEEFFREILLKELNAGFVSCGFNYHFGRDGKGDTTVLASLCRQYGVTLSVSEEIDYDGQSVSSTRIRSAIADGDIRNANAMLGRRFSYDFEVVVGDRRGGKILGFPTINQFFPESFIVPKFGVYASMTYADGRWYPSMTNIGIRPTIGHSAPRSETCILGFSGDLYGKHPEVALIEYLRPEIRFDSLEALSAQMAKDAEHSREIFEKEGQI